MRGRMKGVAVITMLALVSPAVLMAQDDVPQIMQSFDLVTPPGSAVVGVVHVEDIRIGNHRQIHAAVSTIEGSAEFSFDGRTIRMGDGYAVTHETLADTARVSVMRLTASTPDGASAPLTIITNHSTGEISTAGGERYNLMLRGSRDAHLMNQVLPLVLTQAHSAGRLRTMGFNDCARASLAFAGATLGLELACASPVPGACEVAIISWLVALDSLATNCPDAQYDNTIGW